MNRKPALLISHVVHYCQKKHVWASCALIWRPVSTLKSSVNHASVENMRHVFRTCFPFLHKWTRVPDTYEALYQQALTDLEQPGYVSTLDVLTVWGERVSR